MVDSSPDIERDWREATVVRCPECGYERDVDPLDAADERIGGYYCEGIAKRHVPKLLVYAR